MVNISLRNGRKYSVSFFTSERDFGPHGTRWVVECDVFTIIDNELCFSNRGMAILHPQDTFNRTLGMKKALSSAFSYMTRAERKEVQAIVAGW